MVVIPARGGSKRIPKKNIKHFHGQPMIKWSIDAAQAMPETDAVIVSTDDPEIAHIAIQSGALVPFQRPETLAGDLVGVFDPIIHAIHWLTEHGQNPKHICCLFATAPFVTAELLTQGLQALHDHPEKHFAFSTTPFHAPVHRGFMKNADGNLEMLFPEHIGTRSQDLPTVLHDAGMFYWGRPQGYLDRLNVFSEHGHAIQLPTYLVHDLDTEEDWIRAELFFDALQRYQDYQPTLS